MRPEIKALENYLSNNQLSSYYAKQFTASLDDQSAEDLSQILRNQIKRYSAIPRVKKVVDSTTDFQASVQIVMDLFPTAFFVVSNEFYRESVHYKTAKLLQIAGIASILTRDSDQLEYIALMIDDLSSEDSLDELNRKVTETIDLSYFPKVVYDDFVLIRKHYKNLVVTKNVHDLIDIMFSFQGLLQIFLKYYFDLMVNARSDDSAIHINKLFGVLFATLKYQEAKYWNYYSDSKQLQSQIFHVIRMDSPSNRHPVLRKHIFDSLKQYHPIIKDARSRFTTPEVRLVQSKQLEAFLSLSIPRLASLMETVFLTKGRSHLVYLLTQVLKSAHQKLFAIKKYSELEAVSLNKDFVQMIDYFIDKLSSSQQQANKKSSKPSEMGTIIQTAESLRRMKAKKLLQEREKKGTLTYNQVSSFIEQKMSKLHQRVKQEGALTSANIGEYLAKFAETAQTLLAVKPGENKSQAITNLQVSADSIIADIAKDGHLTSKQADRFKAIILEKATRLSDTSEDNHADIVEQIGVALADASIQSDKSRRGKIEKSPAKVSANVVLETSQIADFLENRLENLYIKVKQDGALTQKKIDGYLTLFSRAANKIMVDLPVDKKESEINKFIVSTEHILNDISQKGYISEQTAVEYRSKIETVYPKLKKADEKARTALIEQIGIELANISLESRQRKANGYPPVPVSGSLKTQYTKKVMLRQDEIPKFLEDYLKKLYARVRKDGALTQDQISKYLQQFASTARQIIYHIPPEKRPTVINEFKISTDDILNQMTKGSKLSHNEIAEIRLEIHGKMKQLDTDNQEDRIEVVDQIGLILADTFEKVDDKPAEPGIDKEFLKKEIIPYGLDLSAKLVSTNNFFSFPFGDRKGPSNGDRYDYHFKYLDLAVKEHKLKEEDYEKIISSKSALPKIKYKKYFNIFPNDQFEETTFMAVFDLWQNRALDSLISD